MVVDLVVLAVALAGDLVLAGLVSVSASIFTMFTNAVASFSLVSRGNLELEGDLVGFFVGIALSLHGGEIFGVFLLDF